MRRIVFNIYASKCPCCHKELRWAHDGSIKVRCHSEGEVAVPGLYELIRKCDNPLCEWSKLDFKDKW